jgi:hypothetical protein
LEKEEVATSRTHGSGLVKKETEVERRKLMSKKIPKANELFRKFEKKPLKKFFHIPPAAPPHGEGGRNTVIANQGEEPEEDGSGTAKWVLLVAEGRFSRREKPRTAQESGRVHREGIGEAREHHTQEKEGDLKPKRRTAVGNMKRLRVANGRLHDHRGRFGAKCVI